MTDPTTPTTATLETLAARIAELESENKQLSGRPVPAPQAQDSIRKNSTERLVQVTRGGNVRSTVDPSLEFVAEQAGLYGDEALAGAHDEEANEEPSAS